MCSFVFDEALLLSNRGIQIHVCRADSGETIKVNSNLESHGMQRKTDPLAFPFLIRKLHLISPLGLLTHIGLYSGANYGLNVTRFAKKYAPDIVHAHFAYPEGLAGLLTKHEVRRPLVVTLHGGDIVTEPTVNYGIRLNRGYNAMIRNVLNGADAVLCASNMTYAEASKLVTDQEKLHLIPNGVDILRFNPDVDGSMIRKMLGLQDKSVVFTVRHHEPKYGIEYLIRAIPLVLEKRKDVAFIIGGDGTLRPYHEKLAKSLDVSEYTFFVGRIPQSLLPSYYSMCNISVAPSLQEAFGLVVAEAFASGKPVIGTRVGGIPDQIEDCTNGFLVEPRNPRQIADRICYLLEDPKKAKQMGRNGRVTVEKKFSIIMRINRICELYDELLEH